MNKHFKPLLAEAVDFEHLDYSNLWASAKLDGIRAIVRDGVVVSRNLKPIRNRYVQHMFGRREYEHYDGELIVGDPTAQDCYSVTNSGVMSEDGEPDVVFHVFDHVANPNWEYHQRYNLIAVAYPDVRKVIQHPIVNHDDLLECEQWMLDKGYEGLMLRAFMGPSSFYKYGRSTAKACTLLKLKRFSDAEAEVIGFEEEMENTNEATKDALGHTERSSHRAGLRGKGRLGALICRTPEGQVFNIGTGFDWALRTQLWDERETLAGRLVKYKSFKVGEKDAPRFPVFLGFRDPIDL